MAPPRTPANPRLARIFVWIAFSFAVLSCIAGFVAGGWNIVFGLFGLCCSGMLVKLIGRRRS